MGWDVAEKKVIRLNTDFTGPNVWQQDQQATIKIIASRHDIHDQDLADAITQTINVNGITAMQANLDLNTFKIVNLADGVNPNDSINMGQFDVLQASVDQNTADIAAIETSSPDNQVTDAWWSPSDGAVANPYIGLELVRVNPNIVVDLKRFDDLKIGGSLKHLAATIVSGTLRVLATTTTNRFYMLNSAGTTTLQINRPTGDDPDLGTDYWIEGMAVIENDNPPGTIVLNNDAGPVDPADIIGTPSSTADVKYVLSYMIYRMAGDVYEETYVWSSAP